MARSGVDGDNLISNGRQKRSRTAAGPGVDVQTLFAARVGLSTEGVGGGWNGKERPKSLILGRGERATRDIVFGEACVDSV
jgi:hypothetical protein